MLWIISGPSSVGKTTFIASEKCAELTGLNSDMPVVLPQTVQGTTAAIASEEDVFLHYNIMRMHPHYRQFLSKKKSPKQPAARRGFLNRVGRGLRRRFKITPTKRDVENFLSDRPAALSDDKVWDAIARMNVPMKAIVLVVRKSELLARVRTRAHIGYLDQSSTRRGRQYPQDKWFYLYRSTDLLRMYELWIDELERRRIPYVLVDANDLNYRVIPDKSQLATADSAIESTLTREEVIEAIKQKPFKYHMIMLPYGKQTNGTSHQSTVNLVLPPHLDGKTVLDVGCAAGTFSFEAEARGASRVLGVDLNSDRLDVANHFKKVLDSRIEFVRRDLLEDPITESFDYILFLNVIHHVNDPIRFLRYLASITRECLAIESPTLLDPKFRRATRTLFPGILNQYALIGVQSPELSEQTFVFTPKALQQILTVHEKLFEQVDIIPSPIEGRVIALCYKEPQPASKN